jgi:hypothetical protein
VTPSLVTLVTLAATVDAVNVMPQGGFATGFNRAIVAETDAMPGVSMS